MKTAREWFVAVWNYRVRVTLHIGVLHTPIIPLPLINVTWERVDKP